MIRRYITMKQNKNDGVDYRLLGLKKGNDERRKEQTKVCLKLATLKYHTECNGKYLITEIQDNTGKKVKVQICNNRIKAQFNFANYYGENICYEFADYVDRPHIFKLTDGLKDYKRIQKTNFKQLINTEGKYFIKLFKVTNCTKLERANLGRTWIDYFAQVRGQFFRRKKYIWDANDGYGLWAATASWAKDLLRSNKAQERYGDYAFILEPVNNIFYAVDDREVIGDKFEVVGIFKKQDLLMLLNEYDSLKKICENKKIYINSWKTILEISSKRLNMTIKNLWRKYISC